MTHQPNHIASPVLVKAALLLGCSTVLIIVACWFLWRGYAYAPLRHAPAPATPALQARPAADLAAVRRAQADRDTYGWVDKEHTVARIPVRRAMEIVAGEPKP